MCVWVSPTIKRKNSPCTMLTASDCFLSKLAFLTRDSLKKAFCPGDFGVATSFWNCERQISGSLLASIGCGVAVYVCVCVVCVFCKPNKTWSRLGASVPNGMRRFCKRSKPAWLATEKGSGRLLDEADAYESYLQIIAYSSRKLLHIIWLRPKM